MSRPPAIAAAYKVRIVLSIPAGEMTCAEAARRNKVSETSVSNWKRAFLEGGAAAVESRWSPGPNAVERVLAAEVEELKAALGETHVELRVWKKSA
jgi:transposase